MKKNLFIPLFISIMIFTGCTEILNNANDDEPLMDSDNDGLADGIDLFPEDPNKWNQSHNLPPVAVIIGPEVNMSREYPTFFFGNESYDPDGEIVEYYWVFCDEESSVSTEDVGLNFHLVKCDDYNPILELKSYTPPFEYNLTLTVTDDLGKNNTIRYRGKYP
jgi:hypothetical protein